MQQLIEKHAVGLLFGIVLLFATGYIDMRNLVSKTLYKIDTVEKKVDTVTTISTMTRTEQLLRTDEIEYIQGIRDRYPDWSGQYLQENGNGKKK